MRIIIITRNSLAKLQKLPTVTKVNYYSHYSYARVELVIACSHIAMGGPRNA